MNRMCISAEHNNAEVCRKSSSGGAFTAITDSWYSAYGPKAVVYGCIMDAQLKVRHIRATERCIRDEMRGSKYVGSDMTGILRAVGEDLKNGIYVCFSGTPCQIAGLKSYLKCKEITTDQQLLTLEVICHGVGSVHFFEEYIAQAVRRYGSKVMSCSFRGKTRPGKRQQMLLRFENGKKYVSPSARYDEFLSAYGQNYILRPACFACPYAEQARQADITIGDSWGEHDEVRTLLIASTQWGEHWVNQSKSQMKCREISSAQADQPQLNRPTDKPKDYEYFWRVYRGRGFPAAQVFLGNWTIKGRIRKLLVTIVYHLKLIEGMKWIRNRISKAKDVLCGAQDHE